MNPCPSCLSESNPKFTVGNDWCAECVEVAMRDADREDRRKVKPQLFKV